MLNTAMSPLALQ